MSEDAIPKLISGLKADEALRKEFLVAPSFEAASVIATRNGYPISIADLHARLGENGFLSTLLESELSEAELECISGGLASSVQKKHDDTASGVIGKI